MPVHDLQSLLEHYEWQPAFDAGTMQRARGYAARGQVLELGFSPADPAADEGEVGTLIGRISGHTRTPYICRVDIATAGQRLILDTDCTCPVTFDCKHAAAMLIEATRTGRGQRLAAAPPSVRSVAPAASAASAALAAPAVPATRAAPAPPAPPPRLGPPSPEPAVDLTHWQRWLQSLDAENGFAAGPERQFGVLLRQEESGPNELIAFPAWLRPSKSKARSAALVDPQPLQTDVTLGAVPTPAGGWPPDAAAALATILQARIAFYGNRNWRVIESAHAERSLEYLLAHYPVWWERGSRPLTRAQSLTPELIWQEADNGSQKLAMRLPIKDTLLLQAASLWYVQPAAGRYGRVDGDAKLYERLRTAPWLQPRQAMAVHRQMADGGNAHGLPAPIDRGPPVAIHTAPTAVLQLRVVTARHWRGTTHEFGVASVVMDYAGTRVASATRDDVVRQLLDGRVREVHRDRPYEAYLSQQIETLGLSQAGNVVYGYNPYEGTWAHRDLMLCPDRRQPPAPPEDWLPTIEALQAAGFALEFEPGFPHDQLVEVDDWYGELTPSGNAWFDVALGIEIGGERIDLLPVLRQLLADPAFPRSAPKGEKKRALWRVKLDESRSVELPLARLRTLIEPLLEWLEATPDGDLRVHKSRAAELDGMALPWLGGEALRTQLEQLERARQPAPAPRGFKAVLRPYQRDGLAWLDFLAAAGLGGILADDMGLGKTVQVLAHILAEKQRQRLVHPALVVAPTSLVGNWASESARFAPTLKVLVIHGANRADRYDDISASDLVITTYPLLPRDRDKLVEETFSLLVLDEAQAIKNAHSQAARVVREIPATRRLAMTGTPLENHLGELWAQFDAVEPGLLGGERQFTKLYRTPIEKRGDADRQARLNRRIGSLLLRRRKDDVLADLPAKNEIVRLLELEGPQRELYESLRLAQHERVQEAVKKRGFSQAGIIVLDALLKLRQACCDPRLVKLDSARELKSSAKLDALLELLGGLLGEGRRVLLFSQFTEMLGLIEAALQKRHIDYQMLTGQTPSSKRAALVERFQNGAVPVFLISLKAGGVGLNLTAADTVIHYDPWWNPAVEAQATDRAHRIGQDKPVFVYRLICAGTVEEKIQALQTRKAELAKAVLEGGASQKLRFNETDLAELFGPS